MSKQSKELTAGRESKGVQHRADDEQANEADKVSGRSTRKLDQGEISDAEHEAGQQAAKQKAREGEMSDPAVAPADIAPPDPKARTYEDVAKNIFDKPRQASRFVQFMKQRFPHEEARLVATGVAHDWMLRFQRGNEWEQADSEERKILDGIV